MMEIIVVMITYGSIHMTYFMNLAEYTRYRTLELNRDIRSHSCKFKILDTETNKIDEAEANICVLVYIWFIHLTSSMYYLLSSGYVVYNM